VTFTDETHFKYPKIFQKSPDQLVPVNEELAAALPRADHIVQSKIANPI